MKTQMPGSEPIKNEEDESVQDFQKSHQLFESQASQNTRKQQQPNIKYRINAELVLMVIGVGILIGIIFFVVAYPHDGVQKVKGVELGVEKQMEEVEVEEEEVDLLDGVVATDQVKGDVDEAEKYTSPELKQLLKKGRYFDIHYFVDDFHVKKLPWLAHRQKPKKLKTSISKPRKLLQITKTQEQLNTILQNMKHPKIRPTPLPKRFQRLKTQPDIIDLVYFANQLAGNPNNQDYLQAEYHHYDKKYNIGKYGKQLPLCLALAGKNNGNVIVKMLESIYRQNYTNYRIAHVDDNSNDDTVSNVLEYISTRPDLKQKYNLVVQSYSRNALFNRHFANTKLCRDGDIIVDLDTDDYLIGNQVFQLINSLYQQGNEYKGNKYQVWSLFFSFITCCPNVQIWGQINPEILEKNRYRNGAKWRTTQQRTYLHKLYMKVDARDFVDPINIKKGEYYTQAYDVFMIDGMVELSGPKHLKIVDQFTYFYTGSGNKDHLYPEYCSASGRALPTYNPLNSLSDNPTRNTEKVNQKMKAYVQSLGKSVDKKFSKMKEEVLIAYNNAKIDYLKKQLTQLQEKVGKSVSPLTDQTEKTEGDKIKKQATKDQTKKAEGDKIKKQATKDQTKKAEGDKIKKQATKDQTKKAEGDKIKKQATKDQTKKAEGDQIKKQATKDQTKKAEGDQIKKQATRK